MLVARLSQRAFEFELGPGYGREHAEHKCKHTTLAYQPKSTPLKLICNLSSLTANLQTNSWLSSLLDLSLQNCALQPPASGSMPAGLPTLHLEDCWLLPNKLGWWLFCVGCSG